MSAAKMPIQLPHADLIVPQTSPYQPTKYYSDETVIFLIQQEHEACAKVCEAEHVGENINDPCDNEGDSAYNTALRNAAAAIRAIG